MKPGSELRSKVLGPTRCWIAGVLLLATSPAAAQSDTPDALQRAETAYAEIDFEATREHAIAALRGGGLTPAQLARTYQLLGIASSALSDEDGARDYFVRMLWLDPDADLDASVPPRLRAPYLEARGIRMVRSGQLEVEAGIDRSASSLRVSLRDPSDMARRVRVAARIEGDTEYVAREFEAAHALAVSVDGAADADRIEYYVEVLDMHGNSLLSEGGPFAPRVVGRMGAELGGGDSGAGGEEGVDLLEEPVFWVVVGAVVLAGAAVGAGFAIEARSHVGIQTSIRFGAD